MLKKIFIDGMSCNHCVNHIKEALAELRLIEENGYNSIYKTLNKDENIQSLLEFFAEIVFAYMKHVTNLVDGQMLMNVRINIFDCFLYHSKNGKYGVRGIVVEQNQQLDIMAGYKCIVVIISILI